MATEVGALAFDRATVRSKDVDGRLHVAITAISKANVCPYLGSEIPGWQELGLDKDRIYQLYRDPDELAKAAPTFNNIPVLSEHVPVDAADHRPDLVIGSTGTDAEFDAPYLKNSLVVWANEAIHDIESDRKKELSSAYYYTPDMTPGSIDGVQFDGRMTQIVANHVALVIEGRAGADVVVGDSALITTREPNAASDSTKDNDTMPRPAKDARKAKVRGALVAYLQPKLAADANLEDLTALLDKLDAETPDAADEEVVPAGAEATEPKDDLAAEEPAGDADPIEAAKAFLKGKLSDEDFAEFEKMIGAAAATDEEPDVAEMPQDKTDNTDGTSKVAGDESDDGMVSQTAMDAALKRVAADTRKATLREAAAIQDAIRFVQPWTGAFAMSFDSAEAVYRHAAKTLDIRNAATIHVSALPALIEAQAKPGRNAPRMVAQDAAAAKSFADRHPNAARIIIGA